MVGAIWGLDGCAHRHSPAAEAVSALKADFQHLNLLLNEILQRMAKIEIFVQCSADQQKRAVQKVEEARTSQSKKMEIRISHLEERLKYLNSTELADVQNCKIGDMMAKSLQRSADPKVSLQDSQLIEQKEQRSNSRTSNSNCSTSYMDESNLNQKVEEYKKNMLDAGTGVLKETHIAVSEWREQMLDHIDSFREASDATNKDIDFLRSDIDALFKRQQVQMFSTVIFCLRKSLLEPDAINECIEMLETSEHTLRNEYGIPKELLLLTSHRCSRL